MNTCSIPACQGKPLCEECAKLGYCPKPLDGHQVTEIVLGMKEKMPAGSRMQICGSIAIITLGDAMPDRADLRSCIGFLRAMAKVQGGEESNA